MRKKFTRMTSRFLNERMLFIEVGMNVVRVYYREDLGSLCLQRVNDESPGLCRSVSYLSIILSLSLRSQRVWENLKHFSHFSYFPFLIYQVKLFMINSSPGICPLTNDNKSSRNKLTESMSKEFQHTNT